MSLQKEKIVARDRDHLRQIVFESIEKYGPNCDLNFIDVSQVTDMYCIFWMPGTEAASRKSRRSRYGMKPRRPLPAAYPSRRMIMKR